MIIIVDLDSTLLTTDKKITDYTIDVFRKAQEQGHKVVVNTAYDERDEAKFIVDTIEDIYLRAYMFALKEIPQEVKHFVEIIVDKAYYR